MTKHKKSKFLKYTDRFGDWNGVQGWNSSLTFFQSLFKTRYEEKSFEFDM